MVDEQQFEVERVGLLEALQARGVDEVLDHVVFEQLGQLDGVVEQRVQVTRRQQTEGLVGRCEHRVRSTFKQPNEILFVCLFFFSINDKNRPWAHPKHLSDKRETVRCAPGSGEQSGRRRRPFLMSVT